MALVSLTQNGPVGVIALDNAKKHNALSHQLVAEVIEALKVLEAARARAVILRAQPGSKVWSAGHDISELPEDGRDPLGWNDPLRELVRTIESFHCPVIAMIDGGVWGGAVEVVLACDIIIATPGVDLCGYARQARRALQRERHDDLHECGQSAHRQGAGVYRQPHLGGTRRACGNDQPRRLKQDALETFTVEMATTIAANAPLSISVMKEQLRVLAGAKPLTPRGFEKVQGLRRIVYDSQDYHEGIRAFKGKTQAPFHRPVVWRATRTGHLTLFRHGFWGLMTQVPLKSREKPLSLALVGVEC
jgi:methylmalonyl-CoA decarboxylase